MKKGTQKGAQINEQSIKVGSSKRTLPEVLIVPWRTICYYYISVRHQQSALRYEARPYGR